MENIENEKKMKELTKDLKKKADLVEVFALKFYGDLCRRLSMPETLRRPETCPLITIISFTGFLSMSRDDSLISI